MSNLKKSKLSDLKLDERNINVGSERGNALLEKSLREGGAGRSILIDKNGSVIAGNQTVQKAVELGFENVIIVPADGKTLVAVQRTDLDINSPEGVRMKILDNTVSKHNYIEDAEVMEAICEEYDIEAMEYGLNARKAAEEDEPSGYDQEAQFFLNIRCINETHCQELYEKFIKQGLDVKIVT